MHLRYVTPPSLSYSQTAIENVHGAAMASVALHRAERSMAHSLSLFLSYFSILLDETFSPRIFDAGCEIGRGEIPSINMEKEVCDLCRLNLASHPLFKWSFVLPVPKLNPGQV